MVSCPGFVMVTLVLPRRSLDGLSGFGLLISVVESGNFVCL